MNIDILKNLISNAMKDNLGGQGYFTSKVGMGYIPQILQEVIKNFILENTQYGIINHK